MKVQIILLLVAIMFLACENYEEYDHMVTADL